LKPRRPIFENILIFEKNGGVLTLRIIIKFALTYKAGVREDTLHVQSSHP